VRELMVSELPHVSPGDTLDALVRQVVLPAGRRCFPALADGDLLGLLTVHRIKELRARRRGQARSWCRAPTSRRSGPTTTWRCCSTA
jgi:hypothetical protein